MLCQAQLALRLARLNQILEVVGVGQLILCGLCMWHGDVGMRGNCEWIEYSWRPVCAPARRSTLPVSDYGVQVLVHRSADGSAGPHV